MAAPTEPRWATDGAADVLEPITAKKDIGWANNDHPPAGHLNWLFNTIYLWIRYFLGAPRTIHMSVANGFTTDAGWAISSTDYSLTSASGVGDWVVTIPVRVGDHLGNVRFNIHSVQANETEFSMTLEVRSGVGVLVDSVTALSGVDDADKTVDLGDIDHTVASGEYVIVIINEPTSPVGNHVVYSVEVDVDDVP